MGLQTVPITARSQNINLGALRLFVCRVKYRRNQASFGEGEHLNSSIFCMLLAANFSSAESKALTAVRNKLTKEAILFSGLMCSSCKAKTYNKNFDIDIASNEVVFDVEKTSTSSASYVYRTTITARRTNLNNIPTDISVNFTVKADSVESAIVKAKAVVTNKDTGIFSSDDDMEIICNRELVKTKKQKSE